MSEKEVIDAEVVAEETSSDQTVEQPEKQSKKSGGGLLWVLWLLSTAALTIGLLNLYLGQPWFSFGTYAQKGTKPAQLQQLISQSVQAQVQTLQADIDTKISKAVARQKPHAQQSTQQNISQATEVEKTDVAVTDTEQNTDTEAANTTATSDTTVAQSTETTTNNMLAAKSNMAYEKIQTLQSAQTAFSTQLSGLDGKLAGLSGQVDSLKTAAEQAEQADTTLIRVTPVIEDALRLANLQDKPKAAALLLQSAASTLHATQNPDYLVHEQKLVQAAKDLLQLPAVNVSAIVTEIDSLSEQVDQLVLPGHTGKTKEKSDSAAADWPNLASNVWQDIQGLVKISQDSTHGMAKMVSPEAQSLAYTMMKLYLQRIQLAVLSHQQPQFDVAVKAADQWAQRVFDKEHTNTQKFTEALQSLAQHKVALPTLPDSLQAVQRIVDHD